MRGTADLGTGLRGQGFAAPRDRRAVLSALWIFVLFNYLYADVVMIVFSSALYGNLAARMTEPVLLAAAVLMEIPMAMVVLSRVLNARANRWANVLAGTESTAFVGWSLVLGGMPVHYLFFAAIEMATTLFIVWYAWNWQDHEGSPAKGHSVGAHPEGAS